MAIVKEYVIQEGPAKGATIRIDDDMYANLTPAEQAKRKEKVLQDIAAAFDREARRVAPQILHHLTTAERLALQKAIDEDNQARINAYLRAGYVRVLAER